MDISKITNDHIEYQLTRPELLPFCIVWGGITLFDATDTPITYRNFYALEYIYEGAGIIRQKNREIYVSAGDFLLLTPGYYYEFLTDKAHPWQKIWCAVSNTSFMSGLLSAYNIENVNHFSKLNSPLQLENILDVLESQKNDKESFRAIERMLFETVCALSDASSGGKPISLATIGKNYIDANGLNSSVDDICKQLSISTSYFFRLFKQEYGVSPQKYIMNKKMDVAMDSLRHTNQSISRISELLGYENVSSFSNTFYKKTGMTPVEFRKKYINESTISEK